MIYAEKLTFGFSSTPLFQNLSFHLEENCHCALIGSNGTGKSTLVDMIMDPEKYLYDGKITRAPECRMGYASQFSIRDKNQEQTVFEFLSKRFVETQAEIAAVCEEMASAEDMEEGRSYIYVVEAALSDVADVEDAKYMYEVADGVFSCYYNEYYENLLATYKAVTGNDFVLA